MSTVTIASAENVLKSYYLDAVKDELDNRISPFMAQVAKTTSDVYGKDVVKLVSVGVSGGVGVGTEDGDLPTPSGRNYLRFTTTLKNLYGTIEITDKAIRASKNNAGAFVDLLNAEMEGLIKSSEINFGRMLFGDTTGYLCTVQSVTDGVIVVNDASQLFEGMSVDIPSGLSTGDVENIKVISVNKASNVVVFENFTATSTTVDKNIFVHNLQAEGLTGLKKLCAEDSTLYGIDRSTNGVMVPYLKSKIGTLTEAMVQEALDTIEISSGSKTNLIICAHDTRRALVNAITANRNVLTTGEINGGYKVLEYNGIPVVVDRYCQAGQIYLLNTDDFELHQLCDWQWLEGEDGSVLKQVPGKPVYTATLVKYADLMCKNPRGQGKLSGITG